MDELLLNFFEDYKRYAIFISIFINIVVAIFGIIPSFFITAANLIFFGFWYGTLLSFVGEALGAIIAFYLYRKGFKRFTVPIVEKYPITQKLLCVQGRNAFYLILSLRLLPFIPSGIVTLLSAMGKVSLLVFAIASTIGKIPALLIEAYSVYQVTQWTWTGKLILILFGLYLLYLFLKKVKQS
ncbi:TVP38/TMEM64 family protein [Anaerobacillus sp. MEB173]|uniref:TVP38/TMEM64 family protein n=1 Tax=Anaerobacillus sp. MEB173 TaxID=3383345 RepID=UPI003F928B79